MNKKTAVIDTIDKEILDLSKNAGKVLAKNYNAYLFLEDYIDKLRDLQENYKQALIDYQEKIDYHLNDDRATRYVNSKTHLNIPLNSNERRSLLFWSSKNPYERMEFVYHMDDMGILDKAMQTNVNRRVTLEEYCHKAKAIEQPTNILAARSLRKFQSMNNYQRMQSICLLIDVLLESIRAHETNKIQICWSSDFSVCHIVDNEKTLCGYQIKDLWETASGKEEDIEDICIKCAKSFYKKHKEKN